MRGTNFHADQYIKNITGSEENKMNDRISFSFLEENFPPLTLVHAIDKLRVRENFPERCRLP